MSSSRVVSCLRWGRTEVAERQREHLYGSAGQSGPSYAVVTDLCRSSVWQVTKWERRRWLSPTGLPLSLFGAGSTARSRRRRQHNLSNADCLRSHLKTLIDAAEL